MTTLSISHKVYGRAAGELHSDYAKRMRDVVARYDNLPKLSGKPLSEAQTRVRDMCHQLGFDAQKVADSFVPQKPAHSAGSVPARQ